jgi:hypothetical protein
LELFTCVICNYDIESGKRRSRWIKKKWTLPWTTCGEEVTSFVNKAVSEAKEHKHKHKDKEKSHEDETPPTDETKKE